MILHPLQQITTLHHQLVPLNSLPLPPPHVSNSFNSNINQLPILGILRQITIMRISIPASQNQDLQLLNLQTQSLPSSCPASLATPSNPHTLCHPHKSPTWTWIDYMKAEVKVKVRLETLLPHLSLSPRVLVLQPQAKQAISHP